MPAIQANDKEGAVDDLTELVVPCCPAASRVVTCQKREFLMEETKKSNGRGILILGAVLIVVGIVSINGDLWFSLISVCIGGLCVWSVFWKGQLNRVKKAYRREVATGDAAEPR